MAYIVAVAEQQTEASDDEMTIYTPLAAKVGDILLIIVVQDGASNVLSIAGMTALFAQAGHNAQRMAAFYAIASTPLPPSFKISATSTGVMVATSLLIRDADLTAPFPLVNRVASPATGRTFTIDSGNLTSANSLAILARSTDGATSQAIDIFTKTGTPYTVASNLPLKLKVATAVGLLVGYKAFSSAGATGGFTIKTNIGSEGGTHLLVEVRHRSTEELQKPPVIEIDNLIINLLLGVAGATNTSTAISWAFHSLAAPVLSSLPNMPTCQGVAMSTGTRTLAVLSPLNTISLYDSLCGYCNVTLSTASGATNGEFFGISIPCAAVDLSNSTLMFDATVGSIASGRIGAFGIVIVVKDVDGNLAAYSAIKSADIIPSKVTTFMACLGNLTPVEVYGTVDLTAVTEIHIILNKVALSVSMYLRRLMVVKPVVLTSGSKRAPVLMSHIVDHASAAMSFMLYTALGAKQYKIATGIQIGDGVTETYVDFSFNSIESPTADIDVVEYVNWNPRYGDAGIEVRSSATDVVDLRAAIFSTTRNQPFKFSATSSQLATIKTDGLTLVGYTVEALTAGLVLDGVLLDNCYRSQLLGTRLTNSNIQNSLSAVALYTNDLGLIDNCIFDNPTSHDIEITTAGTYTLAGVSFLSTGANGSITANILNSSGGVVTIQVVDGVAPTIKNTAGSTTNVVLSVPIILTGLQAGTEVRVYDSLSNEIAGIETVIGSSFTFNSTPSALINIVVFHVEYDPLYIDNYETGTTSAVIPIVQNITRSYQP